MAKKDFLTLRDLTGDELRHIVSRATALKHEQPEARTLTLAGRSAALIMELSSTRTRVGFEIGLKQLGANVVFLSADDCQLGRGEPIEDMARVLSGMVDAIILRAQKQSTVETLARYASVPVVNAMTDRYHPCQLLADVQTFEEQRGPIAGRTVAFVGDGYNMCHSYINAAEQWGFNLKIATPKGFEPDAQIVSATNRAVICETPQEAVAEADLVVTDVWSSMGHEGQEGDRRTQFDGYQVNEALLDHAHSETLFMHCLPAHRGEEVSETIIDDPRSVVFDEAHNRLHSQKALAGVLAERVSAGAPGLDFKVVQLAGLFYAVALRVVHADFTKRSKDLFALNVLGNGLLTHIVTDLVDRFHHGMVARGVNDVAYKHPVDLHVIHRQVAQIRVRRQASTEVIQREATANDLHAIHEVDRVIDIRNGRRFGDLETHLAGGRLRLRENCSSTKSGKVSSLIRVARDTLIAEATKLVQLTERCSAIQRNTFSITQRSIDGHAVVGFRRVDELGGRHHVAKLVLTMVSRIS